ncbi:MAG: peptidoglycan-binding protein [Leptolyngbyaceae cyanobacterium MAG.088]|nr:peptidoglycan-binding protein [Leptolyngbyaceae cyanobacterium MAG.088]
MPKLLTTAVVSSICLLLGLPSHAQQQRLAPPSVPPPLPSPSSVPRSAVSPALMPGDSGSDVAALQQALDRNGIDPGPIDGDYGPMTQAAVEQFQQWYDLPVTGVAGPQTLDILGLDVNNISVARTSAGEFNDDFPYVVAVTESSGKLREVRRSFGNAFVDSARQGEFINIGQFDRRSAASDRVRDARRLGFDTRILYRR